MSIPALKDINLTGKRVLIREDFNVPLENGQITSDIRIKMALPTIRYVLEQKAAVILLSHLDRPEEGKPLAKYSLAPVAERLQILLDRPVKFLTHWLDGFAISPGEVVLCENVRFQPGEKKNDVTLAKKIAKLGDVFVMDAFATAHRSEASTVGVIQFAEEVCAGLLFCAEIKALTHALENPARPLFAIVGGAKVSSKLHVLSSLLHKVDALILGGGIANTFLAAQGYQLGKSLVEEDLIAEAKHLLQRAQEKNVEILLPIDVVTAKEISPLAETMMKKVNEIEVDEMVLDCGPESSKRYTQAIEIAKSILWNGPIGVFELKPFEAGTKALSLAIAKSKAFSVAGGGDTLAAIEKYNISDEISYISTGGGAFLEFVEGKELPAIHALKERARGK
jgi:phosphoglycerate kinase